MIVVRRLHQRKCGADRCRDQAVRPVFADPEDTFLLGHKHIPVFGREHRSDRPTRGKMMQRLVSPARVDFIKQPRSENAAVARRAVDAPILSNPYSAKGRAAQPAGRAGRMKKVKRADDPPQLPLRRKRVKKASVAPTVGNGRVKITIPPNRGRPRLKVWRKISPAFPSYDFAGYSPVGLGGSTSGCRAIVFCSRASRC